MSVAYVKDEEYAKAFEACLIVIATLRDSHGRTVCPRVPVIEDAGSPVGFALDTNRVNTALLNALSEITGHDVRFMIVA